ncbi:MAG: PD-(D/E)XK nuclease family protein, partial [Fibrobacteres bacterium]|nr:PD-(D/E)XK nuclease family protein [Fibrobacterota bacterium]
KEDFGDSVALIAKDWNDYLDESLSRSALSLTGHSSSKSTNESAAYLSQYLSLFWQPCHPLDFQSWLLNSLCPLPGITASRVAKALADKPSITGLKWDKILEGTDVEAAEKKALWVDPLFTGIPPENGGQIADICKKIADWANKQSFGYEKNNEELSAEYQSCFQYAKAAAAIFNRHQKTIFTKKDALKVVSELVLSTAGSCDSPAEINSVRIAASPNALAAQYDCVIYWAANRSSVSSEPEKFWNNEEEAELNKNGVSFIPAETRILAAADEWRRAALSAGKRLILITSEISAGEPDGVHPIWHELSIPFSNSLRLEIDSVDFETFNAAENETKNIIKSICDHNLLKQFTLADTNTESDSWKISGSVVPSKPESATGLEILLYCPFRWSLERAAQIRGSAKYSAAQDFTITGTLCHEVIEAFLKKHKDPSDCADIEKELSAFFDEIGPKVYGTFFLPEEKVVCEEARSLVLRAGRAFCNILIASNLKFDSSEDDIKCVLEYGDAHGKPDIVMVRKDNPEVKVVIDLKLGGKTKKISLIKKGRAVQLSQYSKLVQKTSELTEMPPVAFFIINNGTMLADASYADIFKGASLINCDQNAEEQWNDICSTAKANLTNLKNGFVEIGLPDETRLKKRSGDKQYASDCKYCDYKIFCSRSEKKGEE